MKRNRKQKIQKSLEEKNAEANKKSRGLKMDQNPEEFRQKQAEHSQKKRISKWLKTPKSAERKMQKNRRRHM